MCSNSDVSGISYFSFIILFFSSIKQLHLISIQFEIESTEHVNYSFILLGQSNKNYFPEQTWIFTTTKVINLTEYRLLWSFFHFPTPGTIRGIHIFLVGFEWPVMTDYATINNCFCPLQDVFVGFYSNALILVIWNVAGIAFIWAPCYERVRLSQYICTVLKCYDLQQHLIIIA